MRMESINSVFVFVFRVIIIFGRAVVEELARFGATVHTIFGTRKKQLMQEVWAMFRGKLNILVSSLLLQKCLSKNNQLNAESVSVKDMSGDGKIFPINVVSSAFEGQSAVNRQRMVYKAIWEKLQNVCSCRLVKCFTHLQYKKLKN
ncbi:hypothetical protein AALP_AA5G169000 [Arabis alpina]|uniref:Uncharacterized protein n=1 Tax=Arabis alpina TaxID=50452 RepID=A0A087GXL5_ARAAL|nr:hypothetical protein AALP_AA5G169000 [Arabis alpina]